jgi:hypothetical protein
MTSPQDLVAQGAFLLEKAKRRRDAVHAAERQAVTQTGEASSPDGLVRASVDAAAC